MTSSKGPRFPTARPLANRWRAIWDPADEKVTTRLNPDLTRRNLPNEFHGLVDVLIVLRRRILINRFLRVWAGWWTWVLCGVIVTGAFIVKMDGAVRVAIVLLIVGAAAICAWAWHKRESLYDSACQLDASAGLHDRLSTALFLANKAKPDAMLLRQRADALNRVSQIHIRRLFPICAPRDARRVAVLLTIAAAVLLYRAHHQAPMLSLLQVSERSHLLQRAMENRENKIAADQPTDDFANQQASDVWQPAATADDRAPEETAEPTLVDTPNASAPPQSLTKSMMQALKNLLQSNSAQKPSDNGQNLQDPPRKDSQQNSSGQGNSTEKGNQADSQDKAGGEHKSPGAGDKLRDPQPMVKNMVKSSDPSVKIVAQKVGLPSATLKDQPRTRANAEAGTSQMATRNISPEAMAVINGEEPDDIPARYRIYVQHSFEHPVDKQQ